MHRKQEYTRMDPAERSLSSPSEHYIHMPYNVIKGRLGEGAQEGHLSFTAKIDMNNKVLRIDNTNNSDFWIEIDMSAVIDRIKSA